MRKRAPGRRDAGSGSSGSGDRRSGWRGCVHAAKRWLRRRRRRGARGGTLRDDQYWHPTPCPEIQPADAGQDVRLLEASRAGDAGRVEALLREGPAIDARDAKGRTALMFAAMAGHVGVVRLLLDAGADPALEDDLGYDAAAAAAFSGDFRGAIMPPFDEIADLLQQG